MKMMFASSTGSLVRYLLLVSLAAAVVCGSSLKDTDTKKKDLKANIDLDYEFCGIERVTVPVKVEGCEETFTTVRVCNGACDSGQPTILEPPFVSHSCSSCLPTYYRSGKERLIKFMCNGTETLQRVHFPLIKECGCVAALHQIL